MSKGKSTQSVSLPAYQEAQAKELFQAGKSLAGQPFVPYTGPKVAGFNPDQLRQFEATRGLFETGMQYDPLTGLQGLAQQGAPQIGQVGSLLGADIGAYQSPYQQQVIDQSMADIQRQADIARGQSQSQAIGAGAFGGSRSALLESESQRPYIEQQARTAAGLRQSGFEQAQRAAESDIARQQQMAMFAPEFELRARQQQAGLLGGRGRGANGKTWTAWSDWRTTTGSWTSRATISLRRVPKSFGLWASTVWFIGCWSRRLQLQRPLHHKKLGWVIY
jgi:hypothetical protein